MRVFINDIELELPVRFKFPRTKQVNTIGSLNNVQANFSGAIKVPRTKKNTQTLEYLGLIGNSSTTPYRINTARVLNDTGVPEIQNGYAVVRKTAIDYFEIVIYDGYIIFSKEIENRTLGDMPIGQDINHLVNIDTVQESWNQELNYRYIVADYGGKTFFNSNILNIDFLIPSVRISYLWEKLHEYAGFEYEGSVFEMEEFKNLWITYPKTIDSTTESLINGFSRIYTNRLTYVPDIFRPPIKSPSLTGTISPTGTGVNNTYLQGNTTPITTGVGTFNVINTSFTVKVSGRYKFSVRSINNTRISVAGGGGGNIYARKNIPTGGLPELNLITEYQDGDLLDAYTYIELVAGDVVGVDFGFLDPDTGGRIEASIDYVEGNAVNFQEAFLGFGMQEFVNEILIRFSLTPFVDRFENKIRYLTYQERLQTTQVVDWSSENNKFVRRISETYKFGNYAQRNYFRYRYNDRDENHNDNYIFISNKNLPESTTVFNSKFYSPEKAKSSTIGRANVYKLWDKEIKDDGTIEYKDLNNRFYIMRETFDPGVVEVGSESAGTSRTITGGCPVEDFRRLDWKSIIDFYYPPILGIFNTARLAIIEVYLTDIDVEQLRLDYIYYIKEESSYFIINKLPNYIEDGVYRVEVIEVDYYTEEAIDPDTDTSPDESIVLTANVGATDILQTGVFAFGILFNYNTIGYDPPNLNIRATQYTDLPSNGGTPTGLEFNQVAKPMQGFVNVIPFQLPVDTNEYGVYEVQITDPDTGVVSNIVYTEYAPPPPPAPTVFGRITEQDGPFTGVKSIPTVLTFSNFTEPILSVNVKIQPLDIFGNEGNFIDIDTLGSTLQDVEIPVGGVDGLNYAGYYVFHKLTVSVGTASGIVDYFVTLNPSQAI